MFFEFLEKRKINVVNVEAEEFIEAFNRIIAFLLSSNRQICPSQVMLVKRSISLGDFNVMNVLDDVKNEDVYFDLHKLVHKNMSFKDFRLKYENVFPYLQSC